MIGDKMVTSHNWKENIGATNLVVSFALHLFCAKSQVDVLMFLCKPKKIRDVVQLIMGFDQNKKIRDVVQLFMGLDLNKN